MGRVCSALPGSMVDGMGAPRARRYGPAVAYGAPSIVVRGPPTGLDNKEPPGRRPGGFTWSG
jgi:hypothetical protein